MVHAFRGSHLLLRCPDSAAGRLDPVRQAILRSGAGVIRTLLSLGSHVALRSLVTVELRCYRKEERAV